MTTLVQDWIDRANCVGADPEAFFISLSSQTTPFDMTRFETAQRICNECPVRLECLAYARENKCVGLFGGVYVKP